MSPEETNEYCQRLGIAAPKIEDYPGIGQSPRSNGPTRTGGDYNEPS